jgi:TrmH family RNA methyltransferase
MVVSHLTNRNNSLIKMMRLVAAQSHRAPAGLVLAEGIRTLEEAVRAGCRIEAALVSDRFGENDREKALLDSWHKTRAKVYRAPENLLRSVSEVHTHQGALALVEVAVGRLNEQLLHEKPLVVNACGIQDPGNLGTLLRSAAAAGASLVCTAPRTVSARNPKAIRASAGSFFHLPVVEQVPAREFLEYCRARHICPYRAEAGGGVPYFEVDFNRAVALLFGNEGRGASDDDWKEAAPVHVPMAAGIESLNVAAAGAVLLFEAYRQRRANPL